MTKNTVTFGVDSKLKEDFFNAAKQHGLTAAELIRCFMRRYVAEEQNNIEYNDWFRQKVEEGQQAIREGRVITQEEATARAEKRKARLLGELKDNQEKSRTNES